MSACNASAELGSFVGQGKEYRSACTMRPISGIAMCKCETRERRHLLEKVMRAGDNPLTEAPELAPQLRRDLTPPLLQHW